MFKVVRTQKATAQPTIEGLLLIVGIFGSLTFLMTILTFPEFFLFNPFASIDPIRRVFLTLTTVGWVTTLIGPPVLLALHAVGVSKRLHLLDFLALAWPVSLILNHIALLIQTHKLFVGYLSVYPIFIVTDIALPVMYVFIARYLNHKKH